MTASREEVRTLGNLDSLFAENEKRRQAEVTFPGDVPATVKFVEGATTMRVVPLPHTPTPPARRPTGHERKL